MCGAAIVSLMFVGAIPLSGIAVFACMCHTNHPDRILPPLK
jgi:hypothetical protein